MQSGVSFVYRSFAGVSAKAGSAVRHHAAGTDASGDIHALTQTEELRTSGKKEKKRRFYISPFAPLPLACFLLFDMDRAVWASLLAAVLHEGGHLLALRMLGGKVAAFRLYPFGGEIVAGGKLFSYGESMVLSLSGILVNLLSSLLLVLPRTTPFLRSFALASLGLGMFNLLPLRQLDGGGALESFLSFFCMPQTAEKVLKVLSFLTVGMMIFAAFYGALSFCFNPMWILLIVYAIFSLKT